jgi:hypothetical protein
LNEPVDQVAPSIAMTLLCAIAWAASIFAANPSPREETAL